MKPRDLLLTRRHSLAMLLACGSARAQGAYPSRPIMLVVPFGPGGIADLTARAVAKEMSVSLQQPIVIDNRPSAGAIVGASAVAHAEPDGHTMLLLSNANAVSAGLFRKLPFDVQRDFAPVTKIGFFDLALFVARDSSWRSVKDLITQAKAKPGKLTFGTIASGSTQHLAAELFKSMAQIDVVVVPYKAKPAVVTALRTGEIDVALEILGPLRHRSAAAPCARWRSRPIGDSTASGPCPQCRNQACRATWPHRGTRWPCRHARPLQ